MLAFVVAPKSSRRPTRAANGVQFVDEDDGRCGRAGLREQVAHTTGANADDHFDELAGAHAEEGHVRLSSHRACQQCFTRTGWADQQDAPGHGSAQPGVLVGLFEKIDDFDQLLLGFVDASYVGEGDARNAGLSLVVALGAAAAEAEHSSARSGRI